jgi:APA family basic amino acid/polyamine antiporter
MGNSATQSSQPQLVRALTLADTVSLVVGIVIGTGVFLKAAVMAQAVGTPTLVLAAWLGAGILTLAGALSYAELGGLLPHAGGEYVYLRSAYGDAPAFLYGWMRLAVGSTGSIASLAVGFSTFLAALLPLKTVWMERTFHLLGQAVHWQFGEQQLIAVGLILIISAMNCAGVAFGGRIQSVMTAVKILGILLIVFGVLFFSKTIHISSLADPMGAPKWAGMSAFSIAMLAALWAYDGWNQMPMVAGEVQQPQRNVPRALIGGMIVVMFIYCMLNFTYFLTLPFGEIITSSSTLHRDALPVAAKAAQTFLGSSSGQLVSIIFLLSTLGALNGTVLTCARVPFAMARDGLFFRRFGGLSQGSRVPVFSIGIQAAWSSILAMSGTFDQLTDYVIFASWIFYALVVSSVFVLRRTMPAASRPYRSLGYPVVPIIFIGTAGWLILSTLQTRPVESVVGLVLIALGLPLYFYFRRSRRQEPLPGTENRLPKSNETTRIR